jgi:predicted RNA-binding Zn ribbon-like protein
MTAEGKQVRRGTADRLVGQLRFDAGSPSLNLVATVGRRFGQRVERLTDNARLEAWLAGVGVTVDPLPGDAELVRLQELREQLDALFRAVLAGTPPSASLVETVNRVASGAPPPRLRTSDHGVTLDDDTGIDAVLGTIAADAIRIVTGADRARLRHCEADDCRMLYLAEPRQARRWCSSKHCGNRARVARHRARSASAGR